jgi:hypothetical protein
MKPSPAQDEDPAMGLAKAATAVLTSSDQGWSSMAGGLHTWQNESVPFGSDERGPGPGSSPAGARERRTAHRFWATAVPWRIRLDRIPLAVPDEQYLFDTVIVHGQTWWMQRAGGAATDITSNAGLENFKPKATVGCLGLDHMLYPTAIGAVLEISATIAAEIATRPVLVCRGRLVEPRADMAVRMGDLYAAAATSYVFTVDARTGVILRFEAWVGGLIVRWHELREVAFDHAVSPPMESRL